MMKYRRQIIIIIVALIILLLSMAIVNYTLHGHILLKEVNLEAGNDYLLVSNLYKNKNSRNDSKILTDLNKIDFNIVQDVDLYVYDNGKAKKVILHIIDTMPPNVKFKDITANLNYVAKAEDFIESMNDVSDINVLLDHEVIGTNYEDYNVKVTVKDNFGNSISQICKLKISILVSEYTLELGNKITKEDLVFNKDDAKYILEEDIKNINKSPIGSYKINAIKDGKTFTSNVKIVDTTAPKLSLKPVTKYVGEDVSANDFINYVEDISNDVKTKIINTYNTNEVGVTPIKVKAYDGSGNETILETSLTVKNDDDPPKINGLNNITIVTNQEIDYHKGVKAIDAKDGEMSFIVDSSKVDITKSGTYYAIYTSNDKSGNIVTAKRKIIVNNPIKVLAHISIPTYNQKTTGYTLGCEGVSLYMALKGLGYIKDYTLDSFMNTMPYGSTPFEGYMGNPKIGHVGENSGKRTTIYPQPLANWASKFASATDLTGASIEDIKKELDAGHVVLAFVTSSWKDPIWKKYSWSISDAGEVENNHCLCIVGYRENGDFLVNDCHDGRKDGRQGEYWVSGSIFESIYNARHYAISVF